MFPTHEWAIKEHSTNTHLSYSVLCALSFHLFYRPPLLHSLFITNIVQRNSSTSITQSICVDFIEWCTSTAMKIHRNIHLCILILFHTHTHTRTHVHAHTHSCACWSAHFYSPTMDMNFNCRRNKA